ncbi:efflux RND transporter permease subunit [Geobacter sp.]|uniref:efflux RND transporter permease subunit n=1 Tax=Geobacter sp. TaxID=46610 RepID=UPI0026173439|nr:efflux RND transporter permease subunit [Geobacter sp.]
MSLFTSWVQAHRRSILFLVLMMAVAGGAISFRLPVALFPSVDFPRVVISLDAGDRAAELMELQVTRPVEQAVRAVPGVASVRSTSSRGSAEISVNFGWGTDMISAMLQVESAVSRVLPVLPGGTSFEVKRMDPTVFPVLAYSLTSATRSQIELYDIARYQLVPLLSSVNGASRVQVTGGRREEYRVTADPARLQAYGLTLGDVARTLSAANVITAVGRLEDHYKLYLAMVDTRLTTLDEIRQTIVKSGPNGVVRLEEIADVQRDTVPQWQRVTADGRDAVLINVYQQPGGNTVRIAREIKAKLASFRSQLPSGVTIRTWYDQSELIVNSAASVRDAIIIGVILGAAVLLLFLRSLKITLVAIVVVPTVLAATIVLLHLLGMSFNIMTLGGMAAAVGLIIDDVIVMVEHIIRRLRGGRGDHEGRVMAAAREFAQPLAGSSSATIVIFLPLAFLSGVTGAFFKALSVTMAAALIISFLITWLAIPILADHLLGEKEAHREEGGAITIRVHCVYERLMAPLIRRPALVLAGIVPLLILGYVGYRQVGSGFMPVMDEGGFILDYRTPPGTALSETDRLLRQVEAIIRATPDVETYSRRTGAQLGGGLTEANTGDFFIRLKPLPRRPIDVVMDEIRGKVERQVPGLRIELAQLMEDLIGDLTAVPQPIEVKLYADDQRQLFSVARRVADAIGRIPGVVDVRDGIVLAGDALDIHVDRTRAALEGVDPDAVTGMVREYLSGVVTTEVQEGIKMVGVRVWIPPEKRTTEPDIGSFLLRAPDGHLFPLRRVATITPVTGQPEITSENLKPMVAVTGRISGRDMGSVVREVRRVLGQAGLIPRGVYFELGGMYRQQQIAFRGLIGVFVAALALVFLLLLFLYERFRIVLAIAVIPLLSLSAVFVGLWLTGTELNISAMMGMTMIVGIVTEVAIFYFSEYRELLETTEPLSALVEAGKNRMRPIVMTTVVAILTLLPLALAIGQGSAMQQPLAIAIISGLLIQVPLVLVVLPGIFTLLSSEKRKPCRVKEAK